MYVANKENKNDDERLSLLPEVLIMNLMISITNCNSLYPQHINARNEFLNAILSHPVYAELSSQLVGTDYLNENVVNLRKRSYEMKDAASTSHNSIAKILMVQD